jgi:hypothetical protein
MGAYGGVTRVALRECASGLQQRGDVLRFDDPVVSGFGSPSRLVARERLLWQKVAIQPVRMRLKNIFAR